MNRELAERAFLFLVSDGMAMRTLSTKERNDGQIEAVASAGWTIVKAFAPSKDEAVSRALDAYDVACSEGRGTTS